MTRAKRLLRATLILVTSLLAACGDGSQVKNQNRILTTTWEQLPSSTDVEPWFGGNLRVSVLGSYILAGDLRRNVVLLLDSGGSFLRYIGSEGHGPGEFRSPSWVSLSQDGNAYVEPGITRTMSAFSIDGRFLKQIRLDPLPGGLIVSRPSAISDSVFAYLASPAVLAPNRDQIAETPRVALWDAGNWHLLGRHSSLLPDRLRADVTRISELSQRNPEWHFHKGSLVVLPGGEEVVFVSVADPYKVHILSLAGDSRSFTYFRQSQQRQAVVHLGMSTERYEALRAEVPIDFIMGFDQASGERDCVTLGDAQRGMAVLNGYLYVYVESMDAQTGLSGAVFKVDLEEELAVERYKVRVKSPMTLAGITTDGFLVFSQSDSVPGLIAMDSRGGARD